MYKKPSDIKKTIVIEETDLTKTQINYSFYEDFNVLVITKQFIAKDSDIIMGSESMSLPLNVIKEIYSDFFVFLE